VKRYYAVGGQTIALRDSAGTFYLLTDHLGSVVAVLDATGAVVGEQRYRPFGQPRLTPGITQTDRGFTGQQGLSAAGLVDFNARWVDSSLGTFASPDSIIPNLFNPQALNRYGYVLNNPLRYTDPTGHMLSECGQFGEECADFPPPYTPSTSTNANTIGQQATTTSEVFLSPVSPENAVSGFSYSGGDHPGVDLGDDPDDTVRASAFGIVIVADPCSAADCIDQWGQTGPTFNGGYGNVVVIEYPYSTVPIPVRGDFDLASGQSIFYLYAHLQHPPSLIPGEAVGPGDIVGQIGSTGHSTGPHLHLEVRIGTTGSLSPGEMCTDVACGGFQAPTARFNQWYAGTSDNTGAFLHLDPMSVSYYSARELHLLEMELSGSSVR